MFEGARAFGFACLRQTAILASLAALFSSGDCLAQATSLPAVGPGAAPPPPPAAAAPTVQEVTISGNPSLLRVPNPWPWDHIEQPCATFRVSAVASLAAIKLYTTGLGRTQLAEPANESTACSASNLWSDRVTLAKQSSTAIDRLIAVKIDTDALSSPGASLQGSVIALADSKKAGEFALKVERPPREELLTAIIWVFSILIPTFITSFITYLIGQRVATLNAREKQILDFRDFRVTSMKSIMEFFGEVDAVLRAEQEHPGRTISSFIVSRNIFSKMPGSKAVELTTACVKDDLTQIVEMLKELFPEFKEPVARLEASLQARR